jgi:hypothetical protein
MEARRGARIVLLVVLALSVVALAGVIMPSAGATHVSPQQVSGNPSCSDLGNFEELKVEPVASGSHTDGTLSVTVTVSGSSFDWSSNLGVDAVIVKGGPNANVYSYSPEETADSNLTAPINDSNGQPYGLSHISFCYDAGGGQTTSPPTTPPTTPSTPPPSSPPSSPPTSPPETPPTTPPVESPAESPRVLPTIIGGGPGGPDLSGQGEERGAQEEGALPFTGGGLLGEALVGLALVGAGGGLFWAARRRRRA